MGHEHLRDLMLASELHNGFGYVAATKHTRFDLQTSCEAQMFFHLLSFLRW